MVTVYLVNRKTMRVFGIQNHKTLADALSVAEGLQGILPKYGQVTVEVVVRSE